MNLATYDVFHGEFPPIFQNNFLSHLRNQIPIRIYIITFALARAQFVNFSLANDDFCDVMKIFDVEVISKNISPT
jgi:hypothetical protein